jgi:hypothetical protein
MSLKTQHEYGDVTVNPTYGIFKVNFFPLSLVLALFALRVLMICLATGDSSDEDAGDGGAKKARDCAWERVRIGVIGMVC